MRAIRPILAVLLITLAARPAGAGTTRDFMKTLRCEGESAAKTWAVNQAGCSLPANIVYPGDALTFTYQFDNRTDQPLKAKGRADVLRYATETDPFDGFEVASRLLDTVESIPVELDLAPKGHASVTLTPKALAAFGAYAIVIELEGQGRAFASAFVRVPPATPGAVQNPSYALDINPWRNTPPVWMVWKRLGIKGTRQEWGGSPQDFTDPKRTAEYDRVMAGMKAHDITVMLTLSDGGFKQPLDHWRTWLNDKDEMLDTKFDMAALPETDPEFRKWVAAVATRYGWPKGPLNAVELWNEPWEGISISGWGADLPRYRDLYTAMAQGVEDARRDAGVKVLIGGACSSMNTEDKLFCDGTDTFLKWLDFFSIHYQPLCPWGVLKPEWMERKGEYGPVLPWDTESWFANSEDRVLPAIAAMRASGLQRTAGVLHDMVYDVREFDRWDGDQKARSASHQILAPGAAIAAVQHYIGERGFRELLFQNGLPWVFVFDGLPDAAGQARPDDGTVVVVGDLGATHERRMLPFRGVLGLQARQRAQALQARLDALAPGDKDRRNVERQLALAQVLDAATLTFKPEADVQALDFYGNPLPRQGDAVVVPLNGTGYFLRTGGGAGSMAKLLAALRQADIRGYEPVELKARDFLGRIEAKPTLRVRVANVLNREVKGKLTVRAQGLTLAAPEQELTLAPHETRELAIPVTAGKPAPSNLYRTELAFDAGADGRAALAEPLRVNLVESRKVKVDGKLNDWKDALPQSIAADASVERNLTEKAWLPFVKFDEKTPSGFATAYLAADDRFLYFAAKIADNTPYPGGVRFETRNDDVYYYPEVSYEVRKDKDGKPLERKEYRWPAGVRRYSYRRNPDLPSGDRTDNIQLAFGVFAPGSNGMYAAAPGVMPGFIGGKSTDYEYALNPVATNYGGGTEIWRLLAPGVPNKHFYPRQPKAPRDGGPVKDGQLVMKAEGSTRIVEAALPWSEIPDVKRAFDAGQPVRFTYRANNNGAPGLELNANRSVSRVNTYALHDLWSQSWEPQMEFVLEKK